MGSILEKLEQAIKDLLIGWIESNLTNMFTDVNTKVGTIAGEVGQTPSTWNSSIYQMIRGLSENVIVPIAGIIITFVLCYELITMITEKNNLHDMDTWMFFKWFFKAAVAIYLVTNTFDIVLAVFDIGQNVVAGAAGFIHGNRHGGNEHRRTARTVHRNTGYQSVPQNHVHSHYSHPLRQND